MMSLLVVASLIPAVRAQAPLALGLTLVHAASVGIYGWWFGFHFLNRPQWYLDAGFWIFLFASGAVMGAIGVHLVAVGRAQGKRRLYLGAFAGIVAASFAINVWASRDLVTNSLACVIETENSSK
jgi:hypothetical protein